MIERAICARCGGVKGGAFAACPDCGFTPGAAERPLAWLLSAAWLDPEELAEAARRISEGQRPDPGRALLDTARAAIGASARSLGPGLEWRQRAALLAANLLLTPLAGYAVWFGLRESRPAAARDALALTLPVTLLLGLLWLAVVLV